ncbi:MAG: hypothetical protein FWG73_05470, partial [Planctomycetaceae bacterium]|nr:hypothetical protein [Planctomycetaceae bacterium]
TLVQNEQLIRDEILVHSDGFIERVERIGIAQTNDDGLVEVTIRATVQRGKVSRELIRTNVMEQRIDGESLYAQALTKIQAMESEKEMWQVIPAFFRESKVPESLYGARITRQPYYDAAKRKAIIEFEVFVDQTQYNAFVDALRKVLSTLQITTRQQTIRFNSSRDNNGIVSMNRVNSEERLNIIPNGRSGIVFSVNRNIPLTGVTQEGFVVDDDTFAEFQALALKEWLVRVESQDVAGNTLYREERVISELMSTYIGSGSEPRLFFIYPMLFSGGTDRLYNSRDRSALMGGWRFFNRIPLHGDGRSVKMSVELDWTPEQLRNLDSVRFSFHGQ